MSIAERTREAVREHPFLYEALQAGVVNYTAAAAFLDVGDEDAVAAALRRYADDLAGEDDTSSDGSVRVRMERGVGQSEHAGMLAVGGTGFAPDSGALTAILATGAVTLTDAERVFGRCLVADIEVVAAGMAGDTLVLVVGRRDGPDALRLVEGEVA